MIPTQAAKVRELWTRLSCSFCRLLSSVGLVVLGIGFVIKPISTCVLQLDLSTVCLISRRTPVKQNAVATNCVSQDKSPPFINVEVDTDADMMRSLFPFTTTFHMYTLILGNLKKTFLGYLINNLVKASRNLGLVNILQLELFGNCAQGY